MREERIDLGPLSFAERLQIAQAKAAEVLVDPMLLSWYDDDRARESPNGVSECNAAAPTKGVWNYALHRGGALAVWFADRHLFCFRDNGAAAANEPAD